MSLELYNACYNGDFTKAQALLRRGANVNYKYEGWSSLHNAIASQKYDIAALLINAGANVNDKTPEGFPPVVAVAYNGNKDIIALLINKGADVNATNNDGYSALINATGEGHKEIVAMLIRAGANVNYKSKTGISALRNEISNNCHDIAEKLINAGANVNEIYSDGWSPLMVASCKGHKEIVELLLNNGASNFSQKNEEGNVTALIGAAIGGFKAVVESLIKAGAAVSEKTKDKFTAVMGAASNGHKEIVELLLRVGANPHEKASDGISALDYAIQNGYKDIIDLIKRTEGEAQKIALRKKCENISDATINRQLSKSLFGLIGLEDFAMKLSIDLDDFIKGNDSRGRLFWGNSGTGKTEFAQRIAGMREGFPSLDIGYPVFYNSGVDGKLEVKNIIDQIETGGIVLIDEADKCLDPSAAMSNKAEATQLQHSVVTHFSRKKVYWVFIGTFNAMRKGADITYDMLENSIGLELASRVDFFDWEFPKWTLETLLEAVKCICSRRGVCYEDSALLILSQYCLKKGGGIRIFDNLDQILYRKGKLAGSIITQNPFVVTKEIAQEVVSKMG